MLPDSVTQETVIGDGKPYEQSFRSGIKYKDISGQEITGLIEDKKFLKVHWSLPKSIWKKEHNWRYAEAFRDSLSIVSGENLQLLYHESYRGRTNYEEMRMLRVPTSLGIDLRQFDYDILDRTIIVQLANFLVCKSPESEICRRIFRQLSEAARQQTYPAKELLLATILEAALRNLYNIPFDPTSTDRTRNFKPDNWLKQFRGTYLSDEVETGRKWKKATNKVLETQKRLRDRNAHPDWLFTEGGSYSAEKLEETTNDMIFLSRFYGYMILALAGFRNLQPTFPVPIANWSPLLTISRF